ncbi:MAG: hypothetical protein WDO13_17230 [Verrucomicrobiota bacterium]
MTSGSATPAPLTPDSTLTFSFESSLTPQQLDGNSPLFPSDPELTAFVYSGAPFSDAGDKIVVVDETDAAPEPSSAALGAVAALALGAAFRYGRTRKI